MRVEQSATNPDRTLQRPVTADEIREVRRSMALQALTFREGPIPSRQIAKANMMVAWVPNDAEAEQLLQDLLAIGFVQETANGVEITNQGYMELFNKYRYPLFQQSILGSQVKQFGDRLASVENTNMNELLQTGTRFNAIEADVNKVKSEYMKKDYWTFFMYPILAATIPALIIGAVFYAISLWAPHH